MRSAKLLALHTTLYLFTDQSRCTLTANRVPNRAAVSPDAEARCQDLCRA